MDRHARTEDTSFRQNSKLESYNFLFTTSDCMNEFKEDKILHIHQLLLNDTTTGTSLPDLPGLEFEKSVLSF